MREYVVIHTIIFISTLVRAVFGFANALIAMALFAMTGVAMEMATPLVALASLVISVGILITDWKHVHLSSIWHITIAALFGTGIGFLILRKVYHTQQHHLATIKVGLALVIIVFSSYSLLKPTLRLKKHVGFAYLFGLASGILGCLYNINGLPFAMYATLEGWSQRWSTQRFRATLQAYFLITNVFIILSHGFAKLQVLEAGTHFLISLPVIALAIAMGNSLHRMMPQGKFDRWLHLLLILCGLLLLIRVFIFNSTN